MIILKDCYSTSDSTCPPAIDLGGCGLKLENDRGIRVSDIKYPDWVKNFVTWDDNREQWIAWDETQAYELGNGFDSWEQAADYCIEYAKTLNYDD